VLATAASADACRSDGDEHTTTQGCKSATQLAVRVLLSGCGTANLA
jgi:hypothetical protein